MDVQESFNRITLTTCHCISGERYYDPYRKTYLVITPEETIRQKTALFLEKAGVPRGRILTETPVSHYGVIDFIGRMDILVIDPSDVPLLVVECKAPTIPVYAKQVTEQAEKYSQAVSAKYYVVINGIDCFPYAFDESAKKYVPIESLPSYDEMIHRDYVAEDESYPFERSPYSSYYDLTELRSCDWFPYIIGEDTADAMIPAIVNLEECFLDNTDLLHSLPSLSFSLIDDLGVQYRAYGDASGSDFGSGIYRVLRLLDNRTRKQFLIGFSIVTTGKMVDDPRYGTRDGQSVLCIIKNDGNSDDLAVQINLNKCMVVRDATVSLIHNALITRKGKTKRALLEYIADKNSGLVVNNSVLLGEIDASNYLRINSPSMLNLVTNMIEYAVYRTEYKKD